MSGYASGCLSNAICDRCRRKVPYRDLRPDGNSPGLMVCQDPGCWDPRDPWRLPPIQPDNIILRHPRPDTNISSAPPEEEGTASYLELEQGGSLELEQGGSLGLEG